MRKALLKMGIISMALLLVMGVMSLGSETDEPGPIGRNTEITQYV